jgi:D-glycero-alpha-D-manno-heptose-7-phosphate kinase
MPQRSAAPSSSPSRGRSGSTRSASPRPSAACFPIDAVLDAYRAREPRVCGALARMKSLARDMAAALRAGDVDALGRLVGEHWVHQRSLHPTITTARIDAIMDVAARHGGMGGKALGASGGGCVLVFAAEDRADDLAAALEPLGERLRYDIDERGFDVLATLAGEATE